MHYQKLRNGWQPAIPFAPLFMAGLCLIGAYFIARPTNPTAAVQAPLQHKPPVPSLSPGVGSGSAQATYHGTTVDHRYPVAAIGSDGKIIVEFFAFSPTQDVVEKVHSGEKYFGWLGQKTPHVFLKLKPVAGSGELSVENVHDFDVALLNFPNTVAYNGTLDEKYAQSLSGKIAPGERITGHVSYQGDSIDVKFDIQFDVTLPTE